MKAICYTPICKKGYDSNDLDDIEGFGKCDQCKAREIDVLNRAAQILVNKVKTQSMPHFNKRYPMGVLINARDLGVTFDSSPPPAGAQ